MYADIINSLIYEYWIELKITKLREIQKEFDGLTDEQLLECCLGIAKFEDDEGGLTLVHNTDLKNLDEELSIECRAKKFKEKYKKSMDSIVGYSKGVSTYSDENNLDDLDLYINYVAAACRDFKNIPKELKEFNKLVKKNFILDEKQLLLDLLIKEVEEVKEELSQAPEKKELNFDPLYAVNMLGLNKNHTALNFIQITGENGFHYLDEHRIAQRDAYQTNKIVSDDIVDSVWNSGWLAPDGTFYGCPDLNHNDLDDRLWRHLSNGDTNNGETSSRSIEKLGYIKLSSGRWLLPDLDYIPTKRQLEEIIRCQDDKYKTPRTYYKDGFISVEVLKSKLKNKEIYPD